LVKKKFLASRKILRLVKKFKSIKIKIFKLHKKSFLKLKLYEDRFRKNLIVFANRKSLKTNYEKKMFFFLLFLKLKKTFFINKIYARDILKFNKYFTACFITANSFFFLFVKMNKSL